MRTITKIIGVMKGGLGDLASMDVFNPPLVLELVAIKLKAKFVDILASVTS